MRPVRHRDGRSEGPWAGSDALPSRSQNSFVFFLRERERARVSKGQGGERESHEGQTERERERERQEQGSPTTGLDLA